MTDTYRHVWECQNCDQPSEIDIPKGTPVNEHEPENICPSCNCPMYKGL